MLIVIVAESFDCKATGSDNRRMVGCGSFSEIMQVADTIVIASFIFFFISIPAGGRRRAVLRRSGDLAAPQRDLTRHRPPEPGERAGVRARERDARPHTPPLS